MKIWLLCYRTGAFPNLDTDFRSITMNEHTVNSWFTLTDDESFHYYSLEYNIESDGNLVSRYPIYRGGPGV
jgi:hypothetical protein